MICQIICLKMLTIPVFLILLIQLLHLIPDKWFPQFDIELQPNSFRKGDDIESVDSDRNSNNWTGFDWDNSSKYLTVESSREFEVG